MWHTWTQKDRFDESAFISAIKGVRIDESATCDSPKREKDFVEETYGEFPRKLVSSYFLSFSNEKL